MVTAADLGAAVAGLDLGEAAIAIHVSLRSFPKVDGGPAVPTMGNRHFTIPAPSWDRPARNGIDYVADDASAARQPWPGMTDIYTAARTETEAGLGAVSAHVAARDDRIRSRLSPGSLAAVGPRAAELMAAESGEDMFGPYRALAALGGAVLLMGVGLELMTILHLAEVEAGRRPFVRWVRGPDGEPMRSRGGGCSRGFPNLGRVLAPLESNRLVGTSTWRHYKASDLLTVAAGTIGRRPEITRCDQERCIECNDAIAGGPSA